MNTPARLLFIDDEERIRNLLLDFFEDYAEFAPSAASSAEEALEELRREPAELCIVDMRLPGMNGRDFILAACSRGLCPRFLLHTGSMDFSLDDALRAAGLTEADVFLKPCDMSAMLARIRERLANPGA
jgi:two-component system, OmpR family, response regulator